MEKPRIVLSVSALAGRSEGGRRVKPGGFREPGRDEGRTDMGGTRIYVSENKELQVKPRLARAKDCHTLRDLTHNIMPLYAFFKHGGRILKIIG